MKARRYETIFIIVPDLKEEEYVSISKWARNIVRKNGGLVADVEDWGKKRLAYPIRKKQKGLYILLNYFGNEKVVSELERNMRIKEEILRFLTIKLEEETEVDEKTFEEPAEEEAVEVEGEETASDEEEMVTESHEEEALEAGEGEVETEETGEAPMKEDGDDVAGSTAEEIKEDDDTEVIAAEASNRAEDVGEDEDTADKSDQEDEPLAPDEAMEEEGPKDHLDDKI